MLAQVCRKEFWENDNMKYQEVHRLPVSPFVWRFKAFVIHAAHNVFYIYYAKFSNAYLSEIVRHGANFRQKSKKCVTLHRSRKYYMQSRAHRVDFFKDYAKLLWYLTSGKAHVAHLFDYDDNPLYNYVQSSYLLLNFLGCGKCYRYPEYFNHPTWAKRWRHGVSSAWPRGWRRWGRGQRWWCTSAKTAFAYLCLFVLRIGE